MCVKLYSVLEQLVAVVTEDSPKDVNRTVLPNFGSSNVFIRKYFAKVDSEMFGSVQLVVGLFVAHRAGVHRGAVLVYVQLAHVNTFYVIPTFLAIVWWFLLPVYNLMGC